MPADSPIFFSNPAGQLLADAAGFLRVHWAAQPRPLAATQALFSDITQALRARGWSKILIDQTVMPPFSAAEQQWISQEWLPGAVQRGGYRYGAVVVSADAYTRLATAFITTHVGGLPLRYRSFDTEAEAVAWLRRQPG